MTRITHPNKTDSTAIKLSFLIYIRMLIKVVLNKKRNKYLYSSSYINK